jgi:hypothetical protein
VGTSPAPTHEVRQFLRQHLGRWRVQLRASRKEPFYATRESLLGMWQTAKCRERHVLMVRRTEEVVFGPLRGDIEGRAFRNRISGQAPGCRSILTWSTRALRRGLAYGRVRVASPFHHLDGWKQESEKLVKCLAKSEVCANLFPVTDAKPASGCPRGGVLAKRF